MGGPRQLSFPITRLCRATETLGRAVADRLLITSEPGASCTQHPRLRELHRAPRLSYLTESQRLPSESKPSIRLGRPLRTNAHAGRQQRGWRWNIFPENHGLSLKAPTQGLHTGPNQRRHLSRNPASSQEPARENHTPPTCIDLFAGIGASRLALNKIGLKCVYANEPDPDKRATFKRNHAHNMGGLTLDHQDITQVPLDRIPDHTLLASWLPVRSGEAENKKRESRRLRTLEIVEAKNPPIVLVGSVHFQRGGAPPHRPPTTNTRSHNFGLPPSRRNLFIVGVRADQNAPFKFKPAPRRSPGLGLHRCLLSPETVEQVAYIAEMNDELVDGVRILQRHDSHGKIGELPRDNLDALPPNPNKYPYFPVGRWLRSDLLNSTSHPISHHLGFVMGLGTDYAAYWYLVPGPDGRPMVRQLLHREVARLQGLPDEFLIPPSKTKASQQIADSGSPLIMDWVLKAMKKQFPHLLSTNDRRTPSAVAGPHATTASTGPLHSTASGTG
ncbi:dna (cytosine-5-)-methyltransferase protein [Diaporthe eres]|nr:dna (cytosine-5-)-methyltransferase protein [Diaporthe eres]